MKQIDIAKAHNVSPLFVSFLVRGMRRTTDIALALSVAKFTGEKPIVFLSDRKGFRNLALAAHPELGRKVSIHKKSVGQKA